MMKSESDTGLGSGVFASDEWVRFCGESWDLKPIKLALREGDKDIPRLECVLFRDRRGRIVTPPGQLYLGLKFIPTDTLDPIKLSRQWQSVLGRFADILNKVRGAWMAFPPGAEDMRPLRWLNFATEVRYTCKFALPFPLAACGDSVRAAIAKAGADGYSCNRLGPEHAADMMRIFRETGKRRKVSLRVTADVLARGFRLLGPDTFRCYGAWSAAGELVSAAIALWRPGLTGLSWITGTLGRHLAGGVGQLLLSNELADLAEAGCADFDLGGTPFPSTGTADICGGGRLARYYAFRKRDLFYMLEELRAVMKI